MLKEVQMKRILSIIFKEVGIFALSIIIFVISALFFQIILGILGELGLFNFLPDMSNETGVILLSCIISLLIFLIIALPFRRFKIFFRDMLIIGVFLVLYVIYDELLY